jgi:cell division septal protein FtsQ
LRSRPANRSASARTKRNRRKRNWFRITISFLALVLIGELVYLAMTSPRLRVARIDVRGADTVAESDLRDRAKSAMGKNIFLADTQAVRRNVLKNPVVLRAKVYRRPLNRLVIRVEERKPFAFLIAGGKSYLIDEKGFVYAKAGRRISGVLTVELRGTRPVDVACKPYRSLVSGSFRCLEAGRKNNFKIAKISIDPGSNMCLNMESGLWVKLGPPLELDDKFKVLKDVLAHKPEIAAQALYVDMRCVSAPAWKSREASPTP